MKQIITSFLQNHNLNENDINIYLDIYKHHFSFASSISNRTSIDRTTVYSSLKRLIKKGLITQTQVNGVRAFIALSPEIFHDKIDREIEELKAKKKITRLFIETMKKEKTAQFDKPKVEIYEGTEAIITLYEQTLKKNSSQKAFANLTKIPEDLQNFLRKNFIYSKIKKAVQSKVIIPRSKYSDKYKNLDLSSNRETKIVSKLPFKLYSEIILFDQSSVAIIDFHKQLYGILIKSGTLFKTLENLFDYIWNQEL